MSRRSFSWVVHITVIFLSVALTSAVWAAETLPTVSLDDDTQRHAEQKDQVRIVAMNKGRYQSEDEFFILEGDVRIEKGELVIISDAVSIDMNKKIAYISGNIKLVQKSVIIISEALTVFFNDDRAEFVGSVRLVNEDDALELVAELLELNTDTEDFKCEGNVHILKDKNNVYSDSAEYSKEKDEFYFSGDVRVKTEKGETLKAPEVIMYVSTNSFDAVGGVEVLFFIDSEKE